MLPDALFLNIHMYGIMISVGILFCFLVLYGYGKKIKIKMDFLDFMFFNGVMSIMAGFGSAALFQAVYDYIEDPSAGFNFDGGITFLGGLIGGAGFFLIIYFIRRRKIEGRLIDALSMVPCCITIAHAFGRVGCFFAGCCYGKESECIFAVKFPDLPNRVHPTQLYEALFLFALFGVMSYLLLKKKFRYNMSIYLVSYGIFRFLIEFLRGDHRGELVGGISPSQFWSLGMIVLGVVVYFVMREMLKAREGEFIEAADESEDEDVEPDEE